MSRTGLTDGPVKPDHDSTGQEVRSNAGHGPG
jgi:hypothetical protein